MSDNEWELTIDANIEKRLNTNEKAIALLTSRCDAYDNTIKTLIKSLEIRDDTIQRLTIKLNEQHNEINELDGTIKILVANLI